MVEYMNRTDIPNVITDNWRVSDVAYESESTTMNRLQELNIKVDSARQQQYYVRIWEYA
jgi:hypothetical protein